MDAWDGLPQSPGCDGFHWIWEHGARVPEAAEWCSHRKVWFRTGSEVGYLPAEVASNSVYLAPCAEPDTVAQLRAQVSRLGERSAVQDALIADFNTSLLKQDAEIARLRSALGAIRDEAESYGTAVMIARDNLDDCPRRPA